MGHKVLFLAGLMAAGLAAQPALAQDRASLEALSAVGTPYVRGGDTPERGFDCSGLVVYAYRNALGLHLPRRVAELKTVGKPVRLRELAPGDLLFYNTRNAPYSHVGIYIGGGRFVHAPRPGARVRVEDIGKAYWRARFNGARRIESAT
jgi:cell wall-associated NlpC family hydrolase